MATARTVKRPPVTARQTTNVKTSLADRSEWKFLVTTNRNLEAVACEEIEELTGSQSTVSYPGMVRFTAPETAVYTLHARARSFHRVMIEVARAKIDSLQEIYDLAHGLAISQYLGPNQSFAVRAKRRGDHDFGSPDVEREVGQAIIDNYRKQGGARPPVDLDDPAVIFRVIVRDETAVIALDATGQRSLHRRWYRVEEHEAALRPTIAYAMLHYAKFEPSDRLVDPMCGCGTIPIEAALTAMGRPPTINHEPALTRFRFLDAAKYEQLQQKTETEASTGQHTQDIAAFDTDEQAVEATRTNACEAGVELSAAVADATAVDIDADVVVTDMPFGIRTNDELPSLYASFFENLETSQWDRLVVHTAREDLVPFEVSKTVPMRRGRLETSILVIE